MKLITKIAAIFIINLTWSNEIYLKKIDSLLHYENFKDAEKLINNSLITEKNEIKINKYLNRKSSILYKKNKTIEALEILHKNIDFFTKYYDPNELAYSYNNLGNIFLEYNQLEIAEKNYHKSLKYQSNNVNTIYFNLLNIYSEKKEKVKFDYYFNLLKKQDKNIYFQFRLKIYKLQFLYLTNNSENIEFNRTVNELESCIDKINNKNLKIYYNVFLAIKINNEGDSEKAIKILDKCFNELKEAKLEYPLIFILEIKLKIFAKTKKLEDQLNVLNLINKVSIKRHERLTNNLLLDFDKFIINKEVENRILTEKNLISKKNSSYLIVIILLSFTIITFIYFFFFLIKKKESDKKSSEIKTLKAIIEAEENERNRIANEIHDGLGGLLSVVRLKNHIDNSEINILLDQIINETKNISNGLTTEYLKKHKLIDVISDYINLIKNEKIKINFQVLNYTEIKNNSLNTTIYRIIQELINNVIKHSEASEALIQITNYKDTVQITVEDNGKGFDVKKINDNKSIGFFSIQKRVELFNGHINIISKKKIGTSVYIELKIKDEK